MGSLQPPLADALLVGAVAVMLLAVRGLRLGSVDPAERTIWRWFLSGGICVAGAVLLAGLFDLGGAGWPRQTATAVFRAGGLIFCLAGYQGLIRWNRVRTQTSDPADWLNGLGGGCALMALALLVLTGVGHESRATRWEFQLDLASWAGLVVVLGTALSVSALAGLGRDLRMWVIIGGLVTAGAGDVLVLRDAPGGAGIDRLAWLLSVAAVVLVSRRRPTSTTPRMATTQSTVVGSLVVLFVSLAALIVNTGLFTPVNHAVTVYAALAVLGGGLRVVQLVNDLSNLARTRHEARTDELTGIANRRALLSAIEEAVASPLETSLLIVGLDRFKSFNDRYGHSVGDDLLRRTATSLTNAVPAGGLLARLGGDEFALLLVDVPGSEAVRIGRALAEVVEAVVYADARSWQVGVSVGVATATGDTATGDGGQLLHRADAAMYQAKTSGSTIRLYDSDLDDAAQERLILTEDLRVALHPTGRPPGHPPGHPVRPAIPFARGTGTMSPAQVVVFFQPQIDMATGVVAGAEALVRWKHPRLGLLTPDRFIGLAEENGLMDQLTTVVLEQAVEQSLRWSAVGYPLRLSVNLSVGSLGRQELMNSIDTVLEKGISPSDLVLEITESSLMIDPEEALRAMHRITALGVGISIDDYGTGYSSLSYMNDLPATELKIDRSFTMRLPTDPRTAAIVAATVELAHRLGMRLVAEGVEDEATLALLAGMGCDLSQGYLHSRPRPADDFVQWLTTQRVVVPPGG